MAPRRCRPEMDEETRKVGSAAKKVSPGEPKIKNGRVPSRVRGVRFSLFFVLFYELRKAARSPITPFYFIFPVLSAVLNLHLVVTGPFARLQFGKRGLRLNTERYGPYERPSEQRKLVDKQAHGSSDLPILVVSNTNNSSPYADIERAKKNGRRVERNTLPS